MPYVGIGTKKKLPDWNNFCISLLNSLIPIKAGLKHIMLQHKVDTEKELFYDGLFHVCVLVYETLWQVISGIGLKLLFHQFIACKSEIFTADHPPVINCMGCQKMRVEKANYK